MASVAGPTLFSIAPVARRKTTVISSGSRSSTSYRFLGRGLFEFTHAPTVYSHEWRPLIPISAVFISRKCNLRSHVARYSIPGAENEVEARREGPLWSGACRLESAFRTPDDRNRGNWAISDLPWIGRDTLFRNFVGLTKMLHDIGAARGTRYQVRRWRCITLCYILSLSTFLIRASITVFGSRWLYFAVIILFCI